MVYSILARCFAPRSNSKIKYNKCPFLSSDEDEHQDLLTVPALTRRRKSSGDSDDERRPSVTPCETTKILLDHASPSQTMNSVIAKLFRKADFDLNRAQRGIVFLDGMDKIGDKLNNSEAANEQVKKQDFPKKLGVRSVLVLAALSKLAQVCQCVFRRRRRSRPIIRNVWWLSREISVGIERDLTNYRRHHSRRDQSRLRGERVHRYVSHFLRLFRQLPRRDPI